MIEYLSAHYDIACVVLEESEVGGERMAKLGSVVKDIEVVMHPAAGRGLKAFFFRSYFRVKRKIFRPRPFWRQYCPGALTRAVERMYKKTSPFAIIVNFPVLGPCVRNIPGDTLKLMDTHDVWHEKYRNFMAMGKGRILEHYSDPADEARLMADFDAIIAITERDAEIFRKMLPGKPVMTAGVSFKPAGDSESAGPGNHEILFVGGRGTGNEDAVRHFVTGIFPIIRKEIPDAVFTVLGVPQTLKNEFPDTPGLNLIEFIDNLGPYYKRAAAVAVPLRYGTGFKIKVGEALSYGSAVIMTNPAAQGLPEGDGSAYLIRESPADFAEAVVRVLKDTALRASMKKNALRFTAEMLNGDRIYAGLMRMLDGALPAPGEIKHCVR